MSVFIFIFITNFLNFTALVIRLFFLTNLNLLINYFLDYLSSI